MCDSRSEASLGRVNLGIVIPCYNEQEVLPETARRLLALRQRLIDQGDVSEGTRIYFVDDGSSDRTWEIINDLSSSGKPVVGIKLARNLGHQNALLAGLFTAEADAIVSLDADLQDDINAIEEMVRYFRNGVDIVYGVRKVRRSDSCFKRLTAETFYKILRWLGAESIDNHADFRLMSRRAVEALKGYDEVNLYLRGIVPLIGYKTAIVYYDREKRYAGESKYPLKKMVGLAINAITSFSVVPLRIITFIGLTVFAVSMVISIWVVWVRLSSNTAVPGWASTVLPMTFLGGVQLLSIGVLGEYMGKVYIEIKRRPRYLIDQIVQSSDCVRCKAPQENKEKREVIQENSNIPD